MNGICASSMKWLTHIGHVNPVVYYVVVIGLAADDQVCRTWKSMACRSEAFEKKHLIGPRRHHTNEIGIKFRTCLRVHWTRCFHLFPIRSLSLHFAYKKLILNSCFHISAELKIRMRLLLFFTVSQMQWYLLDNKIQCTVLMMRWNV